MRLRCQLISVVNELVHIILALVAVYKQSGRLPFQLLMYVVDELEIVVAGALYAAASMESALPTSPRSRYLPSSLPSIGEKSLLSLNLV
jgi:hypothetical protein